MSDLVGNREDIFSHHTAQMVCVAIEKVGYCLPKPETFQVGLVGGGQGM